MKHVTIEDIHQFVEELEKIGERLKLVLAESKKNNESTDSVAKRIAWERINSSEANEV